VVVVFMREVPGFGPDGETGSSDRIFPLSPGPPNKSRWSTSNWNTTLFFRSPQVLQTRAGGVPQIGTRRYFSALPRSSKQKQVAYLKLEHDVIFPLSPGPPNKSGWSTSNWNTTIFSALPRSSKQEQVEYLKLEHDVIFPLSPGPPNKSGWSTSNWNTTIFFFVFHKIISVPLFEAILHLN